LCVFFRFFFFFFFFSAKTDVYLKLPHHRYSRQEDSSRSEQLHFERALDCGRTDESFASIREQDLMIVESSSNTCEEQN